MDILMTPPSSTLLFGPSYVNLSLILKVVALVTSNLKYSKGYRNAGLGKPDA